MRWSGMSWTRVKTKQPTRARHLWETIQVCSPTPQRCALWVIPFGKVLQKLCITSTMSQQDKPEASQRDEFFRVDDGTENIQDTGSWVACDAKSSYAWKMQVYTGKPGGGRPERENGKPVIVLDYNRNKGGVDNLDKVIGTASGRLPQHGQQKG
ncbi:unnamed protein product [Pleuronectes platessa]|uniref:Uncharacterized protein n=1 Tax=Pleuronectes platessa TaxID=8262 RepID=A0A9N7Y6Y3_PLEPL|nr:unnamed protein product [Pleuronectes platessa]